MQSRDEIAATLDTFDQAHLLNFFDTLAANEQRALLNQVDALPLDSIHGLIESHVKQSPPFHAPTTIEGPVWYPRDAEGEYRPYDAAKYRRLGEDVIRRGKVAAFCVAGGQGTRLGWDGPKGTYPATPIKRKPLFQLFAEYIASTQIKYNSEVPFYIMTSPLNHGDTVAFFNEHNYFGLRAEQVKFFPQGVLPSFDKATGRILLAEKGKIAMNPDGHGGSLRALYTSGALADMRERGVEHISYFQVDNPVVKVIDPLFIGLHVGADDSSGEMSSKMVTKTGPTEKVGNFCVVDGRTSIIEYSDMPEDLAAQRDADGNLVFAGGSVAIHCLSVDFVERLNRDSRDGFGLPFHRAEKKVPYVDFDTGEMVHPETPNAVKLEMFIFDALPLCESSIILEADRVEEFAPIKNATGVDSAESSVKLQTERNARWLETVGVDVARCDDGTVQAEIEIDPLTAIEPQDLLAADLPSRITEGRSVYL